MTRETVEIVKIISQDASHPTRRQTLVERLGICDRSVRRRIEDARRAGVWIVGLLSGGYYITDNAEEWNRFCLSERRRAVSTFKRTARVPVAREEQEQLSI